LLASCAPPDGLIDEQQHFEDSASEFINGRAVRHLLTAHDEATTVEQSVFRLTRLKDIENKLLEIKAPQPRGRGDATIKRESAHRANPSLCRLGGRSSCYGSAGFRPITARRPGGIITPSSRRLRYN
jgi:hypothetical protein